MMQFSRVLILFVLIVFMSCSSDNNDISSAPNNLEYQEILDVSYGSDSKQVYDIYLPEERDNTTKILILVHGGGWVSGDKSSMNTLKDLFRTDFPSIAVVNINYRLSDENTPPYPMQIDDITSVINHLKENKSTYNISEDYGFVGTSAGGHLSLLWSYGFDLENKVKMVCSIVGPTNFTDPEYLNNTDPALQTLIDLYGINPTTEFLEEISPLHRATTQSPPTILFYGGQDPLIPTSQGTALKDKLDELGVVNQFTLYPDAGHGWLGLELLDTWDKLKIFTQTHF